MAAESGGSVVAVGSYPVGAPRLRLGEEWVHNRLTMFASMGGWSAPHRCAPAWDRRRMVDFVANLLFCDRAADGEGIFSTTVRVVIDSWIEPNASVGLHAHIDNEEIYYLFEGRLTVTTIAADATVATAELSPGDAHACLLGQSHSCVAGVQGARVLSVSVGASRPTP